MGLKEIVDNNSYPIVFIGSGISKRYLEESDSWEELLQRYWKKLKISTPFYSEMHDLTKKYSDLSDEDIGFNVNTEIATIIKEKFDNGFYNGDIHVAGLTDKMAYQQNISPFKFDLCNHFKKAHLKSNIDK